MQMRLGIIRNGRREGRVQIPSIFEVSVERMGTRQKTQSARLLWVDKKHGAQEMRARTSDEIMPAWCRQTGD